jgi:hypothetical protein
MTGDMLDCPYCNARVPLSAGAIVGSRLTCSSCGETFLWKSTQDVVGAYSRPESDSEPATRFHADSVRGGNSYRLALSVICICLALAGWFVARAYTLSHTPDGGSSLIAFDVAVLIAGVVVLISMLVIVGRDRANRAVGLSVLGGMGLMACLGLALALWTQEARRSHDKGLPPELLPRRHKRTTGPGIPETIERPPIVVEESTRSPDRLAALGYLPRGTNVVMAADVGEWERWQSEKPSLRQPLLVMGNELPPRDFQPWTGLKNNQIDHLILGATIPAASKGTLPVPGVYLIVRARSTIVVSDVLDALHSSADQGSTKSQKTIYPVTLPQPVGKALLWFADERTLVFNLFGDDELKKVPFARKAGLGQLTPEVGAALVDRLRGPSPLWAIVHMDDSAQMEGIASLRGSVMPKAVVESMKKLRTVAVWVEGDRLANSAAAGCVLGCAGLGSALLRNESRLVLRAEVRAVDSISANGLLMLLQPDWVQQHGLSAEQEDVWVSVTWSADRATIEKVLAK